MRSLRSTTALLALLVTGWSSLTAFPCGDVLAAAGADAQAPTPESAHVQHGHGPHRGSAPATASGDDQQSPSEHAGRECAVLMSCGAALRAGPAALVHALLSPPLDDAPFATIAEPSAADHTQDPPPPRRHALI